MIRYTQPEVCKLNIEAGNVLFKQRVLGTTCWELSEGRQLRYYDGKFVPGPCGQPGAGSGDTEVQTVVSATTRPSHLKAKS
jgi:hypothetical protein